MDLMVESKGLSVEDIAVGNNVEQEDVVGELPNNNNSSFANSNNKRTNRRNRRASSRLRQVLGNETSYEAIMNYMKLSKQSRMDALSAEEEAKASANKFYNSSNNGNNNFTMSNQTIFSDMGMITDAKFHDLNNDTWPDLIIVGEWMPVTILINNNGIFENHSNQFGLENTSGLWNTIELVDVNQDNQIDLIIGNHGTNSFLEKNMRMYINDFDSNGSFEQIICFGYGRL